MNIETSWSVIHAWLNREASAAEANLRRGLVGPGIERAERTMRVLLPTDYRASLTMHDGDDFPTGLIEGWKLSPLASVVQTWKMLKELWDEGTFAHEEDPSLPVDGGVRPHWWLPRWIPVTEDGAGNHHILDLDPAPGGTAGQVVTFFHDSGRREVVASSFDEFLADFASRLERGMCEVAYSPTGLLYGVRARP